MIEACAVNRPTVTTIQPGGMNVILPVRRSR